ncbi:MAG: hypothetical protein ACJ8GK_00080 [Luteimonas sp.]
MPMSAGEYAAGVAALDANVGPEQRRALLDRNEAALNDLLFGRTTMRCAVFAGDDV